MEPFGPPPGPSPIPGNSVGIPPFEQSAGGPDEPPFDFSQLLGTPLGDPQAISEIVTSGETPGASETESIAEGSIAPGRDADQRLFLDDTQRDELTRELMDILENYDPVMEARWKTEDEIENAYALSKSRTGTSGDYQGAAEFISEKTMSAVDQAKARIIGSLFDVKPMVRVEPIESATPAGTMAVEMAESAEAFLENYLKRRMKIRQLLSISTLRLCKIGTSVMRVDWEEREEPVYTVDDTGERAIDSQRRGDVRIDLVRNRDMIVWPAWIFDWQRDYEIIGHRRVLTISQWRVEAKKLEIDPELAEKIERRASGEVDTSNDEPARRQEIEPGPISSLKGFVRLTELWCNRIIPGYDQPVKFQVILHEDLREILWIDYNRLDCRKHPYFPVRYKITDSSAWADGIGHELLMAQAADTAFRNLELDNLQSSAFGILLLKQGTLAHALMDKAHPGMRVPTEDPEGDVKVQSLAVGGALEMLYQAIAANESRATNATGLASVLSGQGDPTMKSGAGTGAVMALIEQAGKKFGDVDAQVRDDLSELFGFLLEIIAQYAPEGLYYEHATDDQAAKLSLMRYVPPRYSVAEMFRVTAQAPSATNNKESLKQNLLLIYNFLMQHAQLLVNFASQVYQSENPAGYIPFLHRLTDFINAVAVKVVEYHDLPGGLKPAMPSIDPPTPPEQIINQLQMQLQQALQLLAQAQQASMGAGGAGIPAPAGAGAPGAPPPTSPSPPGPAFSGGMA